MTLSELMDTLKRESQIFENNRDLQNGIIRKTNY